MGLTGNTAENISELSTYISAAAAVAFWGLSLVDIAVIASSIFAGLSFGVHVWITVRRDKREAERHKREMGVDKDNLE